MDNELINGVKISPLRIIETEGGNKGSVEWIQFMNTMKEMDYINVKEDLEIIGGIKLRIGNKIFDNSISYQINQLKKTLHNM